MRELGRAVEIARVKLVRELTHVPGRPCPFPLGSAGLFAAPTDLQSSPASFGDSLTGQKESGSAYSGTEARGNVQFASWSRPLVQVIDQPNGLCPCGASFRVSTPPIPDDLRSEYPFEPHSLLIGGSRYSYIDEGAGSVLLFVHGNPTWSFAWRNLIQGLRPHYRCIAVDHLGMGLSEKPRKYGYTIRQHIDNLTTLIRHLDLRNVTLIGHDWGGCIGMGAAGADPDRFFRFVMMNTAAFRSRRMPLRIAACRIPILGALGVRGLNLFSRAALSMAVENRGMMTPTVRRGYLFPYDSWEHRIAVHRFVQEIPLSPAHPTWPTLVQVEEGLSQFRRHPMLLAWGMKDWCFSPPFLEEWRRRFPEAEVAEFPEAGHYLFEDARDELMSRIERFLASTSGPSA